MATARRLRQVIAAAAECWRVAQSELGRGIGTGSRGRVEKQLAKNTPITVSLVEVAAKAGNKKKNGKVETLLA